MSVYDREVSFEAPKFKLYLLPDCPLWHYNLEQDSQKLKNVSGQGKRYVIVVDNMLAHD